MKEENVLRTNIAVAEFEAINQDIADLNKTIEHLSELVDDLLEFKNKAQALFPSLAKRKGL